MSNTDYSKIFGKTGEMLSMDLTNLLDYMQDKVAKELPGTNLGVEYFVIALLGQKASKAYTSLSKIASETALEIIYDTYYQIISLKTISAIKPNRTLKFNESLINCINESEEDMKKLNDTSINSVHVLLHLLGENTTDGKFRMALNKLGINYEAIFEGCILDSAGKKNGRK